MTHSSISLWDTATKIQRELTDTHWSTDHFLQLIETKSSEVTKTPWRHMANTEKHWARPLTFSRHYDPSLTFLLDRDGLGHAVCRHIEPQNMQTQKVTSYLVENILLLCGSKRYMERVEGERGYIHCRGCSCRGKRSENGVIRHILWCSDAEWIHIIPSLMLYGISPPASYLMLFCRFICIILTYFFKVVIWSQ